MSNKAKKVDALLKAAKSKREVTLSKATKALHELQSTSQVVTFSAVAKQANISVAWLYRQPSIRKQIEQLRTKSLASLITYKKSENTLLCHLKARVKKLEHENNELRKQLEIVYGELYMQTKSDV